MTRQNPPQHGSGPRYPQELSRSIGWSGVTAHSGYNMPLWPLPPVLALLALGYVAYERPRNLLAITGIELVIGLIWWAAVVLPQRGRARTLKQPALSDEVSEPGIPAALGP